MTQALRVREFMTTDVHTVTPKTNIMRAVRRLVESDISGLLVIEETGELVGILTERDCIAVALQAAYYDEAAGRVEDFMSTNVNTINADASMMDLAQTFARSSFRRCPVLDNGRLAGHICRRDVLRALLGGRWFQVPGGFKR